MTSLVMREKSKKSGGHGRGAINGRVAIMQRTSQLELAEAEEVQKNASKESVKHCLHSANAKAFKGKKQAN